VFRSGDKLLIRSYKGRDGLPIGRHRDFSKIVVFDATSKVAVVEEQSYDCEFLRDTNAANPNRGAVVVRALKVHEPTVEFKILRQLVSVFIDGEKAGANLPPAVAERKAALQADLRRAADLLSGMVDCLIREVKVGGLNDVPVNRFTIAMSDRTLTINIRVSGDDVLAEDTEQVLLSLRRPLPWDVALRLAPLGSLEGVVNQTGVTLRGSRPDDPERTIPASEVTFVGVSEHRSGVVLSARGRHLYCDVPHLRISCDRGGVWRRDVPAVNWFDRLTEGVESVKTLIIEDLFEDRKETYATWANVLRRCRSLADLRIVDRGVRRWVHEGESADGYRAGGESLVHCPEFHLVYVGEDGVSVDVGSIGEERVDVSLFVSQTCEWLTVYRRSKAALTAEVHPEFDSIYAAFERHDVSVN
jgi:hypothetical protein